MPPHGLSLEEVVYPDDADLAARAVMTRARRDPAEGRTHGQVERAGA
jgi:tRNA pseudouridine38-40 synthase